jgi:hypothetical protein
MARVRGGFYGEQASPDRADEPLGLDLSGAAQLDGLALEVALLRALIKRAIQQGEGGEARRLIQALCAALALQQRLAGQPVDADRRTIRQVLAEIARDEAGGAEGGR